MIMSQRTGLCLTALLYIFELHMKLYNCCNFLKYPFLLKQVIAEDGFNIFSILLIWIFM